MKTTALNKKTELFNAEVDIGIIFSEDFIQLSLPNVVDIRLHSKFVYATIYNPD